MHFITITSDWSKQDFYIGALEGSILSTCPEVTIIHLSHSVKPYNTAEAGFIVRNASPKFPAGTIHLMAVNTQPAPDCQHLLAKVEDQYFISADNGFLGLLGDPEPEEVFRLPVPSERSSASFPVLDIMVPAACSLVQGKKPAEIGAPVKDYNKQIPLRATLENDTITGTVIYIDSYGNAITNISSELFHRIGQSRPFEIYVQSKHYKIDTLNTHYAETTAGDLLALFNSVGLLEVAIRNGSASGLLNLNTGSTIRIEFKKK